MNKLYAQIHKLSEQAQLSVIWREIKFKKVVFSELPNEFILFKQFNISAKKMYQNLLALYSVDASHQEVIPVEDIYAITNSMDSLSMRKQGKGKRPKDNADSQDQSSTMSDLQWPLQEEDFVIMLQEEGWSLGSVQSFDPDCDIIYVQSLMALKTRAKDDKGKTYWVYPDVEVED